ncbi:MAG: hypothetical protein U1A72_23200 [Sulfuritalea sp.]|nr:hypothetical protein [Sulfuritalea sp.]
MSAGEFEELAAVVDHLVQVAFNLGFVLGVLVSVAVYFLAGLGRGSRVN